MAKNEAAFSYHFSYQLADGPAQKLSNFAPVHSVRDRGVGGSNPLGPTKSLIFLKKTRRTQSGWSLGFCCDFSRSEPSGGYFKSHLKSELFEISQLCPVAIALVQPSVEAKRYPHVTRAQ